MTEGYVRSETHQYITSIEFHHPLSNSLPGSILHAMAAEIHKAGEDPATRVIVLRSAGTGAFCAGASFDELKAIETGDQGAQFFSGFAHVINAMRKCPKLIIARIQGKCVGGGVGIAAAADYAIALEAADVKLSELSIGFGPFVIAPAVERKIGLAAFSSLAIDSSMWRNAEWALRKGLYSEMYTTTEALDESVARLADRLAHYNPAAMQELKHVLWRGTDGWDQLLAERAGISGSLVLSEFTKNAIAKIRK